MSTGLRVGDKIANISDFFESKLSFKFNNDSALELLLIFFSHDCPACLKGISNWKEILAKSEKRIKPIGISLSNESETTDFLKNNNINFDIIIDDNSIITDNFQIRSVPAKILLNMDNVIEFIQIGAGSKRSNDELMQIISNRKELQ